MRNAFPCRIGIFTLIYLLTVGLGYPIRSNTYVLAALIVEMGLLSITMVRKMR